MHTQKKKNVDWYRYIIKSQDDCSKKPQHVENALALASQSIQSCSILTISCSLKIQMWSIPGILLVINLTTTFNINIPYYLFSHLSGLRHSALVHSKTYLTAVWHAAKLKNIKAYAWIPNNSRQKIPKPHQKKHLKSVVLFRSEVPFLLFISKFTSFPLFPLLYPGGHYVDFWANYALHHAWWQIQCHSTGIKPCPFWSKEDTIVKPEVHTQTKSRKPKIYYALGSLLT